MAQDKAIAGTIRAGGPRDQPAVRRIAEEVFAVFGEYGSWLPSYLEHPGVWSYVYEVDEQVVGFAMLGVLEPEDEKGGRVGDLLAIAVAHGRQSRGVGSALLAQVTAKAKQLKTVLQLEEVRLTVAETNEAARRLFESFGFHEMEGDHGHYDKGQRALRLRLRL